MIEAPSAGPADPSGAAKYSVTRNQQVNKTSKFK
jgi:hypothetical protein